MTAMQVYIKVLWEVSTRSLRAYATKN